MKIYLKVLGNLQRRVVEDITQPLEINDGTSVDGLLTRLGLADHNYLVVVNDDYLKREDFAEHIMQDKDEVTISPPIKGG